MKYAIQALLRFDTRDERDKVVAELMIAAKKQFPQDDTFIQMHRCYHDEDPTESCVLEATWHPS